MRYAIKLEDKTPNAVQNIIARYNITKLVYFEPFRDVRDAIVREKQIKGWVRRKKVALIESTNASWQDLSELW